MKLSNRVQRINLAYNFCLNLISPPIIIIDQSFVEGIYALSWEATKVVPLWKNLICGSNGHPIGYLLVLSKIMERTTVQ